MNLIKTTALFLVLFAVPSFGQSYDRTRIAPPRPNYAQYGSYSRQLRVYENTQKRLDELDRRRYRKFREEVRRDNRRRRSRLVYADRHVTRGYTCRERRCN